MAGLDPASDQVREWRFADGGSYRRHRAL